MRSRKKSNKSITEKKPVKSSLTVHDLGKVFDKHAKHEFVDHDVEATMKTMVEEPYVHNVATLKGGRGYKGVYDFYKNHFVGKMPSDTTVARVSRTLGGDQVVDELIISFTHDRG